MSHCFELVYKDVMIDLIADTIDKAIQNQKDESTGSVSSSECMNKFQNFICINIPGPGCSKVMTSLVNVSLKFQTLIS